MTTVTSVQAGQGPAAGAGHPGDRDHAGAGAGVRAVSHQPRGAQPRLQRGRGHRAAEGEAEGGLHEQTGARGGLRAEDEPGRCHKCCPEHVQLLAGTPV